MDVVLRRAGRGVGNRADRRVPGAGEATSGRLGRLLEEETVGRKERDLSFSLGPVRCIPARAGLASKSRLPQQRTKLNRDLAPTEAFPPVDWQFLRAVSAVPGSCRLQR